MIPSKLCSLSSIRTVGVIALMMAAVLSQVIVLEGHVVTSRDDDDDTTGVISVRDGRSRSVGSKSSSSSSSASASDCVPVTNEILWVRLNLHTKPVGTWTPRPDRKEPRRSTAGASSKRRGHDSSRRRRDVDGWSGELHSGSSLPATTTPRSSNSSSTSGMHTNRNRQADAQLRRHQKHHRQRKKIEDRKRDGGSSSGGAGLPSDPTSMLRSTSWHCRMEQQWKKMEDGVFPAYLQTGRCRQEKCVEGLYECAPKRYSVKLLKRIPNVCYPLPVLGRNSSFEDAWTFVNYNIIVGCECTRKRDVGTYYSSRSPSAELGDNS